MGMSLPSTALHPYVRMCNSSTRLPWTRMRRYSVWSGFSQQTQIHRAERRFKAMYRKMPPIPQTLACYSLRSCAGHPHVSGGSVECICKFCSQFKSTWSAVGDANATPNSASGVKKCLGMYAYDFYKATQMDADRWKTTTLSTNMYSAELWEFLLQLIQKQTVHVFSQSFYSKVKFYKYVSITLHFLVQDLLRRGHQFKTHKIR